jgi:hypothetical protein
MEVSMIRMLRRILPLTVGLTIVIGILAPTPASAIKLYTSGCFGDFTIPDVAGSGYTSSIYFGYIDVWRSRCSSGPQDVIVIYRDWTWNANVGRWEPGSISRNVRLGRGQTSAGTIYGPTYYTQRHYNSVDIIIRWVNANTGNELGRVRLDYQRVADYRCIRLCDVYSDPNVGAYMYLY